MLTARQRTRLSVVLVGARNPGNIGAAARAMQDFGFSDLRVVNPFAPPFEAAQLRAQELTDVVGDHEAADIAAKAAVGAGSVLQTARRFDSLLPALADCTLVVGTTAVGGRGLARPVLTLQDAAPRLLRTLQNVTPAADPADSDPEPRVALLFGSEKTGLTTEHLSFCADLLTIPMYAPLEERHLSMNLGQSVAVCLYELVREGFEGSRISGPPMPQLATAADRARLLNLLQDVNEQSGYARRFPANSREPILRQLIEGLATNHAEAVTWMGILKHTLLSFRGTSDPKS